MEKAILIKNIADLQKWPTENYTRVYLGEEFCENLFLQLSDVKEIQTLVNKAGQAFTIITPYMTNRGLRKLATLLGELDHSAPGLEVVVNDWGALYYLKNHCPEITLVVGRLLNKFKRDPRIAICQENLSEEIYQFYQRSNLLTAPSLELLYELGVKRVEFDCPLQGVKIEPALLRYSVHYPYSYITTTRLCINNPNTWQTPKVYGCSQENCQRSVLEYVLDNMPVDIYQKGNTLFYRNNRVAPDELEAMGFDRLIEHAEFL